MVAYEQNNLRLEGTLHTVDQLAPNGVWKTVRTDSHPSTVYRWNRTNVLLGTSTVNVSWYVTRTVRFGLPSRVDTTVL